MTIQIIAAFKFQQKLYINSYSGHLYKKGKMKKLVVGITALILFNLSPTWAQMKACIPRQFDQDSIVCVCNSTYCDEIFSSSNNNPMLYYDSYTTTLDGKRFDYFDGTIELSPDIPDFAEIGNETFQEIIGFGGAFTDAATINIKSLSKGAQQNLINSYFSDNGIRYTIGRIPMASCDFSKSIYSYDDHEDDFDLKFFNLTQMDLDYKIPVIKAAMGASKKKVSLFGSPWSSPPWMKTNNNMTGKGTIKGQPGGEYHKSWAKYFVKFLQQYQKHGLDIWGLTAQNEPSDGLIDHFPFQCLGWTPELQRDFIAKDLGPALNDAGFGHVKLMILDDQRVFLPYWAETVLRDSPAAKYVSGIAVHWYEDLLVPPSALDITYEQFGQDFFMLNTEACMQDLINKNRSVLLGNWYRAERYFRDIMQDLQHKVSGWVDWNIALDMRGGPNWQNNFADSPIIVNADKDEFYKQPMFYAMGHFSKFVVPGSRMVEIVNQTEGIDTVAFLRPDNSAVAIFGNYGDMEKSFTLHDPHAGYLNSKVLPRSFTTFTWWRY